MYTLVTGQGDNWYLTWPGTFWDIFTNDNIRHLVYKFQDLEQQFLKTKSNISSKLFERHQQCSTSDNITERLLSIRSPRLYFERLKENRGGGEVGVCHPVLHFPYPFSDQTSKIHSHFRIWPLGRNYFINTWNRAQTKKILQMHFEFTFYFVLIHLELKR